LKIKNKEDSMVPAAVLFLLMLLANVTPAWAETYGLPFRFELNRGQADSSVKYVAHAAGFTAGLNEKTVTLNLPHPVRMKFVGANPHVNITPQAEMALRSHYYRGESSNWHTDIKNYERLLYRDVYPGIDAVFRGDGRILEFDFLVHPGSNPESIALDFSGQQDITIDEDGVLLLKTQDGDVRLHAPRIHQENNQQRRPVAGRFVKKGERFGFQLADYDKSQLLVIDPALTFSTYVDQGAGNEMPTGITFDQAGNLYISYSTFDAGDFNEFQFVVYKIPRDASPGYITNIWEFRTNTFANAITIDASGDAYIAGTADNTPPGPQTVPTVNAIQPQDGGGIDAFVVKLDPTGKILFSTYLGGSGDESATAIGLDGAGGFWVAGTTTSTNFPTRNAFQNNNAGDRDGFLTRLNTAGTAILYSTYFGGDGQDAIKRLLIDSSGNVFVAGETASSTFPGISEGLQSSTPDCTDSANGGVARPCVRIFLSKLNAAGTAVIQSSALKSTGTDNFLNGFARAPDGSLFISRASTPGTAPATYFVEKFNAAFGSIYSKQIFAKVNDIAVDTSGSVYLTGSVETVDVKGVQLAQFPIVNSFRPTTTDTDLFVMKLPPDGGFPVYSTLLSATCTFCPNPDGSSEVGHVIATDAQNRAYVAGTSTGTDFPTTDGSRGFPPFRVSNFDPVVFVLDGNVPDSTTLYTHLEEWNPFIAYTGTWFPNASPNSGHSGGTAKLALDSGSKFSVSFTGAGELKWFGCKDEWSGIARVFLDGTLRGTVDTYSTPGSCRQLIFSLPGIGPGSHNFTVEVTGTRNPASHSNWIWIDTVEITSVGDITLATTGTGAGSSGGTTRIEQTSSAIQYSGHWFQNTNIVHSGGSAVLATDTGSKATLSFTGSGVQWIGFADQWSGIANVFVDGVFKTEVDTFASPARAKTVLYSTTGLSPGNHTITIEVTGRRSEMSAQSWVWIDAFDVTGAGDGPTSGGTNGAFTRVEQDSGAVQKTGQWFTNVNGTHSGGTAILALDAGTQVRFTFTGTAVRWIGLKDNWAGIAKVFIDGVLQGEIDTYATATQVKTVLFETTGLTAGSHAIAVETTGRKNAAAKSAWVWVDAFEFR
jgi:Beta-propeller repeat